MYLIQEFYLGYWRNVGKALTEAAGLVALDQLIQMYKIYPASDLTKYRVILEGMGVQKINKNKVFNLLEEIMA